MTTSSMRILLASDDVQLRLQLSGLLIALGYDVIATGSAGPCTRRSNADWDAVIVDAAAPHAAARCIHALEASTRVPTIAIAATSNADAVKRLWNRVDAVLHEPLDARKLLLIMRALLASRRGTTRAVPSLTDAETRVLSELMLAQNTTVSRDRLTRSGLGRGWSPEDRCVTTRIKRLRRRVGTDRRGRTPIRTARGVSYLLLERCSRRAIALVAYRPRARGGPEFRF